MKKENKLAEKDQDQLINRKKALLRISKYTVYTAATMMLLMSPVASVVAQNSPTHRAPHRPKRH